KIGGVLKNVYGVEKELVKRNVDIFSKLECVVGSDKWLVEGALCDLYEEFFKVVKNKMVKMVDNYSQAAMTKVETVMALLEFAGIQEENQKKKNVINLIVLATY
ncbi:hypothetical protein R6Q57_002152, partial [Mikania cordata]